MPTQFDKEQQETAAYDTNTQTDKCRRQVTHHLLSTRQHQQEGCTYQDQSRHHFAFQFRITEHEMLGNDSQQEAHHHHHIEKRCGDHRHHQSYHDGYHDHINEQQGAIRQEETVQTDGMEMFLRGAEREINQSDEQQGGTSTDHRSYQHTGESQHLHEINTPQRS